MERRPEENENLNPVEAIDPEILIEPVSEVKANRFYDRIRSNIAAYIERRGPALGKSAEYLFLVPDVFMLLFRLANDKRVTGKNKVLLGTGLAYFIFPLDIMPEAILGPIGFLDDLVFGVYILSRMLNDTDEAILRQHWSGRGDLLDMIRRVLHSADTLVGRDFLAKIKKMF